MDGGEGITSVLNKRIDAFLDRVTYKEMMINGYTWKYMAVGNMEGKPVVFLPGGFRHPLWSFSVLDLFLDSYRIIAPCYPPICDLDHVIDGVKRILEHENMHNCHMMGSSWGGSMVQCMTYKYPDIADKIVLSNTGSVYSKLMIPALKLHKRMIMKQPKEKVLSDYRKKAMELWSKPPEYKEFWSGLLHRFYSELFGYDDYVALIQNQIDYIERYAFNLLKDPHYKKPVLIITSKDETASTRKVRSKVREIYENHRYYEFEIGGHAVALRNPDEYRKLVCSFFEDD